MPDFSVEDLEISPYEYVSACRGSEIRDLIIELVDEGHLPKSVLNQIKTGKSGNPKTSVLEDEFLEKMNKLSQKFHSLTKEDEETLENIFKKYL
jgi:hypothetical protein